MYVAAATATPRGVELQVETPRGVQQHGPPSNRVWPAPMPLAESAAEGRNPMRSLTEGEDTPRKHLTFSQTQLDITDKSEEQLRRTQEAVIGWASAPTVQIADTNTAHQGSPRPIQSRRSAGLSSPRPPVASPLGAAPAAGPRNSNTGSVAATSLFGFPDDDTFNAPSRQQSGRVRSWLRWLKDKWHAHVGSKCCGGEDDWDQAMAMHHEKPKRKLPIIMPHDHRYQWWWFFTMFIALVTAALDPYRMAFQESAGLYPYNDIWACLEYIAIIIFVIDIVSKFFLAYRDRAEGMVTDHKRIAMHYMRWMFWVDIISTFPIDGVVAAALGLTHHSQNRTASLVGAVRWLRIARLYRIFDLFELLEHKMVVSQVTLILLRNNMYVIYTTHWMACLFYWLGTYEDTYTDWSWISRHRERWDGQSVVAKYIYSVYFSVSAFAGLGDGDFYIATPMESFIMILYLLFNIVLQAYILGTITMVMVKGDEKSTVYRHRMEALQSFAESNALPDSLSTAMKEHLELQFLRDTVSDEQVLADYPATLRRKALRHLYAHCLGGCTLFRGLRGRFLDQLLVGCRCELFMPHVSLLSEGDVVSELMIIVDGEARGVPVGHNHPDLTRMRTSTNLAAAELLDMTHKFATAAARRKSIMALASQGSEVMHSGGGGFSGHAAVYSQGSMASSGDNQMSIMKPKLERCQIAMRSQASDGSAPSAHGPSGHGYTFRHSVSFSRHSTQTGMSTGVMWDASAALDGTKLYGPCDPIGAVPFFTDTGSVESVYTTSVTRVLILTKTVFDNLTQNYPQQIRTLLENLRDSTEEEFLEELESANAANNTAIDAAKLREALNANSSFTGGSSQHGAAPVSLPPELRVAELAATLPTDKKQRLLQLEVLHKNVGDIFRKQKAMRVYEFLLAAAAGDLQTIRNMLQQGVKPGSMDYDRRNALIVASHEGQDAVVRLLLAHQAPLDAKDAFGNTALMSALKQGHDHVVALLLQAGAPLGMEPEDGFAFLSRAVTDGDLHQLRRFLTVGVDANWAGYDGTTALHLAATEGNLPAVELLVDVGDAQVSMKDRRGLTPLDEARQAGHTAVVEYLTPVLEEQQRELEHKQETERFLQEMHANQRHQASEHHTTFMIGTHTDNAEYTPLSGPQASHTSHKTDASGLGPEASSPSVSEKGRRQGLRHTASVSSSPRRSIGSYRAIMNEDEEAEEILKQLTGKGGRRRSSLHSRTSHSPPSTTLQQSVSPLPSNNGIGNRQHAVSGSGTEPLQVLDSPTQVGNAVQVAADISTHLGVFGSAMLQRLSPPGHMGNKEWPHVGQKTPPASAASEQPTVDRPSAGQPLAESRAMAASSAPSTSDQGFTTGPAAPVVPPLNLKGFSPEAGNAQGIGTAANDAQSAVVKSKATAQGIAGLSPGVRGPTATASASGEASPLQADATPCPDPRSPPTSESGYAQPAGLPKDGAPQAQQAHGAVGHAGNGAPVALEIMDLPTPHLSMIGSARTMLHKQGTMSAQNSGTLSEAAVAARSSARGTVPDRNSAQLLAAASFRMSTLQAAAQSGTGRRSTTGTTQSSLPPGRMATARTSLPTLDPKPDAATAAVASTGPQHWPAAQAKTLEPLAGSGPVAGAGEGTSAASGMDISSDTTRAPAALPTEGSSSIAAGLGTKPAGTTSSQGNAVKQGSTKSPAKEGAGQKLLGGVTRGSLK